MNCEKCQELLSDWLDNGLPASARISVGAHLADCFDCLAIHDDLEALVSQCFAQRGQYDAVPHEEAMWRRISNVIEAEQSIHAPRLPAAPQPGLWARWRHNTWQLSLPQLAGSMAALALVVSLVTLSFSKTTLGFFKDWGNASGAAIMATGPRAEAIVKERQNVMEYWQKRVEQRKAAWNPQMRQAFDYNLNVLDQAVHETRQELAASPQDEISEERLNAALEDKLELLKEFAQL